MEKTGTKKVGEEKENVDTITHPFLPIGTPPENLKLGGEVGGNLYDRLYSEYGAFYNKFTD